MDKLQWLKDRQKGIGGSDIGAIMGMNRWKSAFQVFMEKTEEITEVAEAAEAMNWGNNFRELLIKEFKRITGKKVRRYNKLLVSKEYPFMLGTVDRRVLNENSIVICKTTSIFGKKEWEGEEIPQNYILQAQHYMAVTKADKCYLVVLIGGQQLLIKELLRDEELIARIIEACKDFWTQYVEKRIPPPLDGSINAEKYLKEAYPKGSKNLEVNLKTEDKEKIAKYLELKENIKALEEEAKTIENNIKNELGEAEKGTVDEFIVNWRSICSSRIDSKLLKENYPEVYSTVSKESLSRRFEIKLYQYNQ